MSLLAELKRRNVIRMAGLYLVGAWLLIQIAETLLPIFHTPDWVLQVVVVLLALGLLPALVFSWIYELTPEGLKRDSELERSQSIAAATGQRMDRLLLVGMLLVLAVIAADRYWPREQTGRGAAVDAARETGEATLGASPSVQGRAGNTIAVLPFVNMSSDPEQEYFSDGISEEILNVLARMPDLQVAARTSSFSFKGDRQDISQIADALKVRLVLEGSVRKQGDRVRITAQLIEAGGGFHLWSETYDRQLEDIFAIQDEIARAIASELKLQLSQTPAAQPREAVPTEAHDRYLRALALWQTRGEKELWEAVALLGEAIEIAPGYAQAHAGLGLVYAVIASYTSKITEKDAEALARDHAEQAVALDPSLPEPFATLGNLANAERRRAASQRLFERAVHLGPSYATAYHWQSHAMREAGELPEALASIERAAVLDPRSGVIMFNHGFVLDALGRHAEARGLCEKAPVELRDNWICAGVVANAALYAGDLAAARDSNKRWAMEMKSERGLPLALELIDDVFDALEGRGDHEALARLLAQAPAQGLSDPDSPFVLGPVETVPVLVMLGQHELALAYLENWERQPSSQAIASVLILPALDPIRCHPRFAALVEKVGARDPHFARVCAGNHS